MMFRWIIYLQQNIPGNISFTLDRVASIDAAKDAFREFCYDVYSDDCSASVYAYSDEAWAEAEDFRDVGCPLDYPDFTIGRGPRGGVRVEST